VKKSIEVTSSFSEYDNVDELPAADRQLMARARESVKNAYAPYSDFRVGAAVLLANGEVVAGNNQENASYPVGLCAERVAIFAAAANYPGIEMKAIAITASSKQFNVNKPVTPCGACRQAISEYEHLHKNSIRIIMMGENGKILVSDNVKQLLPYQFSADDLSLK
jgi:cytidine deaminase